MRILALTGTGEPVRVSKQKNKARVSLRGRVRSELGFGARQGSTYRGAAATRQQRPVSHERHEARPRQLAPQGVRVLDGLDVLSQPRRVQAGEEQRPLHKLGQQINQHVLGVPPVRVTAEDTQQRTLRLTTPAMTGPDVEALERALAERGWAINIDGVFDDGTKRCVTQFQDEVGLVADGIAGPATLSALDLA